MESQWNISAQNPSGSDSQVDLALHCGAGEARMNLGSLNLRSLQVQMGAGQVDLDLTGHPTRDYEVDISGGGYHSVTPGSGHPGRSSWKVRQQVNGGIGEIRIIG